MARAGARAGPVLIASLFTRVWFPVGEAQKQKPRTVAGAGFVAGWY
jgi:hypothetical protein